MNASDNHGTLQIKKYPNRRYYDASRSRHITLHEIYDLIVAGQDICIIDSRSGKDLTNHALLQIILEQDQPKLDLLPPSLLHLLIRSNRQMLHAALERGFGPFRALASQPPGLDQASAPAETARDAAQPDGEETIDGLRAQVAELTRRIERLASDAWQE